MLAGADQHCGRSVAWLRAKLCVSELNRVSGNIPSCVGSASALQLLRLGGNALTGGLLPLPPNSQLRVLNMTGNQMDGTHRIYSSVASVQSGMMLHSSDLYMNSR
jgi:hypothetical protein